MPILATKSKGSNFEPIAEGSYPARIYQIIHLGTIPGFQGSMQNKVRISFEFPTELKVFKEENGEQPQVLSKEYTLSTHEKSGLRKLITACDPTAFKKISEDDFQEEYDIEKLLGKCCLVSVIHKDAKAGDAVYANIDVETVMPKGMVCDPQINESKSLSYDNFDESLFNSLPSFIQEKMKQSYEYKKMTEDPNEVPFPDSYNNGDEDIKLEDIPFE